MTKRSSGRAAARAIYRELAKGHPPSLRFGAASPPPGSSDAAAPPAPGSGAENLTTRVRALYEDSGVPVREIATLVGVTERTIYKYVSKQNWKRRYATAPGVAPGFVPVKGAGGRFIRRADKGKPIATGLKATDPQGHTRAAAACEQAARFSDAAQAKALAHSRAEQRIIWIATTNRLLAEYNAFLRQRAERQRPPPKKKKEKRAKGGTRMEKYDRIVGSAYPNTSAAQELLKEPSKEPPGKAHPLRGRLPAAELSPLEIKLEALHMLLIEKAVGHWQALLDKPSGPAPA